MVGVQLAEAVFVSAPRAQLVVKRIRQGHQGKLRVPAHMQVGSLRRIGRDGQRHTTVNRLIIIEKRQLTGYGLQETQIRERKDVGTRKDDKNYLFFSPC